MVLIKYVYWYFGLWFLIQLIFVSIQKPKLAHGSESVIFDGNMNVIDLKVHVFLLKPEYRQRIRLGNCLMNVRHAV